CNFGSKDDGCLFECHCVGSTSCDNLTGSCGENDSCPTDGYINSFWSGWGCLTGYISKGKDVEQSGGNKSDAAKAVDGNIVLNESRCAHPTEVDGKIWWSIDLEGLYVITNIVIYSTNNEKGKH
ncbi:hypothetical protein LSH36_13g23024, partial [Paralvinella palmiformis]